MLYKILKFLFRKTIIRVYEKGHNKGYGIGFDKGMENLIDKVINNKVVDTKLRTGKVIKISPKRRTGRTQF